MGGIHFLGLSQGLPNSALQFGPLFVCINKVLLEHSHSHGIYGCFHCCKTQSSVATEIVWPTKPRHLLLNPLQKTFAQH